MNILVLLWSTSFWGIIGGAMLWGLAEGLPYVYHGMKKTYLMVMKGSKK